MNATDELAAIQATQAAYWHARNTNTPSHCAECGGSLAGAYRSFEKPHLCTTCSVCETAAVPDIPKRCQSGVDLIGVKLAEEAGA